METALYIVMILLSILLLIVVLMQAKGTSFSGGFSAESNSISSTRRGLEKTLFELTIAIAVIWALVAIVLSAVVD